jgi:hypothetical protein
VTADDLLQPMPYSPDCAQGKHRACAGTAWDFDADELVACACGCHTEPEAVAA